jgi:hypothetical protein
VAGVIVSVPSAAAAVAVPAAVALAFVVFEKTIAKRFVKGLHRPRYIIVGSLLLLLLLRMWMRFEQQTLAIVGKQSL